MPSPFIPYKSNRTSSLDDFSVTCDAKLFHELAGPIVVDCIAPEDNFPLNVSFTTNSCSLSGASVVRIILAVPGVAPLRPKIITGSPGRTASICATLIPNSPSLLFSEADHEFNPASPNVNNKTESLEWILSTY